MLTFLVVVAVPMLTPILLGRLLRRAGRRYPPAPPALIVQPTGVGRTWPAWWTHAEHWWEDT